MKTLVILLEEQSMEEMLRILVPRILKTDWDVKYISFAGKQDLEKNTLRKMKAWLTPDTAFLVIRDQDSGDCKAVKEKLLGYCRESGKESYLVRIACRELESFYFGDLDAVADAFGMPEIRRKKENRLYRDPDAMENPKSELKKMTGFKYQPLLGSRLIAHHMVLERNRSKSFQVLVAGIRTLTGSPA